MFGRRQVQSGLPWLRTAKLAIAVAFASWPAFAQTVPGWTSAWGTPQQALAPNPCEQRDVAPYRPRDRAGRCDPAAV
jgi:hypothetical protein